MSALPENPKKIKQRISRYERDLRQEQQRFGAIDDGGGKRYLLGPLYLLAGDLSGALRSFAWFEKTFPDDSGDPFHTLCWTLALYQSGDLAAATRKLRHTMLSNLYLIPHLLGLDQPELAIWHSSNLDRKAYLQDAPPGIFALWDQDALHWLETTYHSPAMAQVRARYIEIFAQLKVERPGPTRSRLVEEAFRLREMG
jgi:hypothetical protein